jgi:nitrate reductase NapAB chaperone NapD
LIITGSAIFVNPGDSQTVLERLREFPEITFQVCSENGSELIVNFEAQNQDELDELCRHLRMAVPEIIDIGHVYINFEDEVEQMRGLSRD